MTHSRPAKCVIPWCIFLALMFVSPAVCFAANHYVWCGAGGSGSGNDWSNAFTDLPVSLVRGDTYVVAGNSVCRYNFHLFNDAVSGTSVITVRKANAAQDSGVAGWQSSFETRRGPRRVRAARGPRARGVPHRPRPSALRRRR